MAAQSAILCAWVAAAAVAIAQTASVPVLSLWYRGDPRGVARASDLDDIRAHGFMSITWPQSDAPGAADAALLAADAGLRTVMRAAATPLTPSSARHPDEQVDVDVTSGPASALSPLIWRAIAHGARTISIDPGAGRGAALEDRSGQPGAWLTTVAEISRQLRINGALFAELRSVSGLRIDPSAPVAFDAALLDARRSWVLMVTNTSPAAVHASVQLPPDVPYAIWLNLLDGSTVAMLSQPAGPRWNADLAPWAVKVLVIDKILK